MKETVIKEINTTKLIWVTIRGGCYLTAFLALLFLIDDKITNITKTKLILINIWAILTASSILYDVLKNTIKNTTNIQKPEVSKQLNTSKGDT